MKLRRYLLPPALDQSARNEAFLAHVYRQARSDLEVTV